MVNHLISMHDLDRRKIIRLLKLTKKIKKHPKKYKNKLEGKNLLMLFAKPSLRTRLSFEIAMLKLGGHAIFYDIANSTLGKKESIKDFALVSSRYFNCIMARVYEQKDLEELAKFSQVPVINGLSNREHPCQALSDLFTIKEKFGRLKKLDIAYIGDANNNVTHSLIIICNILGLDITISSPNKKEFLPDNSVIG